MKEQLFQKVLVAPVNRRRNLAREYLQLFLLRQAHEVGGLAELAMVGGTALRLLHQLPRFSEDLDFSARGAQDTKRNPLEPATLFSDLKRRLLAAGYNVSVKAKTVRTVAQAFYRFAEIPLELGLTKDRRLGLSVKLKIDMNPPAGGRVETTLIQRFFPIALRHFDLPSLFAGKLHALLTRPYVKGRDWYDLVWYLTEQRGLNPNEELLNNALSQTGHTPLRAGAWPRAVARRLESLDWEAVLGDILPFAELPSDLDQLSIVRVKKLLRSARTER